MQRRCRRVAVVGQSLGGLLARELAARRPELALVASLAAPLDGIAGRAERWLAGPLGRVAPWIPERTTRARARRRRVLPRSFHLIAIDVERDIVAAEAIAFLRRHAAGQLPGDLPCVT